MKKIQDIFDDLVTAYVELTCASANEYEDGNISKKEFEIICSAESEISRGLRFFRDTILDLPYTKSS